MLGHQTPSKAPEMSNISPMTYFLVEFSAMLLILTMASSVEFPGLKPYCLLEVSGWLCDRKEILLAISFSRTFPSTGSRDIGL